MADRSAVLREDIGEEHLESDAKLRRHLAANPIKAWTNSGSVRRNGAAGNDKVYFEYHEGIFRWVGSDLGPHRARFAELLRELVDWWMAEFIDRLNHRSGFFCRIIASNERPIIKLPARTGETKIPSDWVAVELDGLSYLAKFAKQYINVIRKTTESKENLLREILRTWYGPTVGKTGTRFLVQLLQEGDVWHLRRV
jgi:hypothetical protein